MAKYILVQLQTYSVDKTKQKTCLSYVCTKDLTLNELCRRPVVPLLHTSNHWQGGDHGNPTWRAFYNRAITNSHIAQIFHLFFWLIAPAKFHATICQCARAKAEVVNVAALVVHSLADFSTNAALGQVRFILRNLGVTASINWLRCYLRVSNAQSYLVDWLAVVHKPNMICETNAPKLNNDCASEFYIHNSLMSLGTVMRLLNGDSNVVASVQSFRGTIDCHRFSWTEAMQLAWFALILEDRSTARSSRVSSSRL